MLEHIRLILLAVGGLIILGIVADGLRRSYKRNKQFKLMTQQELDLTVSSDDSYDDVLSEVRVAGPEEAQQEADSTKQSSITENDLIVISIMATETDALDGLKVKNAIDNLGFAPIAEQSIYSFHEGIKDNGRVMFGLASATNPGTFNPEDLDSYKCKGLTLFMDMRNSSNPLSAFEQMLKISVSLRQILGGELREGQRKPWTPQSARACREGIRLYMARKEAVSHS